MYSVVTWEIDPGPGDVALIESDALTALGGRTLCDIYGDVRIVAVASATDFTLLHEALTAVGQNHPGQFRHASWALRSGSPMRTSVDFDQDVAREVIVG